MCVCFNMSLQGAIAMSYLPRIINTDITDQYSALSLKSCIYLENGHFKPKI